MKKLNKLLIILSAVCIIITGCNSEQKEESASTEKQGDTIKLIDANFSEGKLIARMAKMLVEEYTDFEIEIMDEMAQVNIFKETQAGNADMFNSYDGTVLTTFLHLDPKDVPKDMTLYDFANSELKKRDNMVMLDMLGNNNTYAIALRPDVYEKYKIETISELSEIADELSFGAEHEFFTAEGSAKFYPMAEFYDLNFKKVMRIDIGLKYVAVDNNEIDSTIVYTTDGLNLKSNLHVLEDDMHFFPDYNGALVIRQDTIDKYGEELINALNKLEGKLPNDVMVQLTYKCDVEMQDVDEVAREFLVEEGLIK